MQVRNFKVVPLHDLRRKHILIDNLTLKGIMEQLQIHPTKVSEKTGRRIQLSDAEFISARAMYASSADPNRQCNPHWFTTFLNWKKVRRMERNSKQFHYELITDGISVSIKFRHINKSQQPSSFDELVALQATKYQQFGSNARNDLYDTIVGIDPGYKLYIAAVVKNMRTNVETHVKISSKQFYSTTRQNYRDKKAKRWTIDHENAARSGRRNIVHRISVVAGASIHGVHSARNEILPQRHRIVYHPQVLPIASGQTHTDAMCNGRNRSQAN